MVEESAIAFESDMEAIDDTAQTNIKCILGQILPVIHSEDITNNKLKDLPDVIRYVKNLAKCIELQQVRIDELSRELTQYRNERSQSFSNTATQTLNSDHLESSSWCANADTSTIVEQVTEAAESAMGETGFAYEETSGLYFDYKSGYYYNAELGLYYDGNTGEYYRYDAESQSFKYHVYQNCHERSQSNPCQNVNRLKENVDGNECPSEPRHIGPVSQDEVKEHSLKKNSAPESNGYERPDMDTSTDSPSTESSAPEKNGHKRPDMDSSAENSAPESNGYELPDMDSSTDSPVAESSFSGSVYSPDESEHEVISPQMKSNLNGEDLNHEHPGHVNISMKRKHEEDECTSNKLVKRRKNADSDAESREEGECSDTDSREETMDSCIIFTSPPASPEPDPPCIRIIIKESTIPELKIGSLFIVTCFGGSIGRDIKNDIILPDESVSQCHIKFTYNSTDNKYYVSDCGSRNGSFINDRRMSDALEKSDPFEVIHGSVLKVGSTELLCHVHDESNTCGHCEPGLIQRYPPPALVSSEPEPWPPCIRIIIKESTIPELKIGSLFIITCYGGSVGRDINNDIILPDVLVSQCHANFTYNSTDNKYYVCDCGSRNGSFINGRRMSDALEISEPFEVVHGSVLKVGSIKLLCHIHVGTNTCGHCEPGLVQRNTPPAMEPKPVYSPRKEHQKECLRLRRRFGLEKSDLAVPTGYADRAQIRRSTVGSHNEYEKTHSASVDEPIASDNRGYSLLKKMGWSEGEVLGKDGTGCSEPVRLVSNEGKSGLGTTPTQPLFTSDTKLSRKIGLLQKIQKRFDELQ